LGKSPAPGGALSTVGDAARAAAARLGKAGVPSVQREARELLAAVLGRRASEVALLARERLTEGQRDALELLVRERCRRRPLAQVLGSWTFSGGDIRLFTPDSVLVPRPETEELLEWAVEQADRRERGLVVDVGTGSGCLAIALAKRLPKARVAAVDISAEALAVARRNAELNGVAARIEFLEADLLGFPVEGASLIVANLPYVRSGDIEGLEPEVRHEPRVALDGGPDGMALIDRLLPQAFTALKPGGKICLEVGYDQAAKTASRLKKAGFAGVETRRDINGVERFVGGKKG
jgi:release factor glutamine methyltransferase